MISRTRKDHVAVRTSFVLALLLIIVLGEAITTVKSQDVVRKSDAKQKQEIQTKEELSLASLKVDVKPIARDEEIRQRLQSVLNATEWFTDAQVRVEQGVVFLSGETETDERELA